MIKLMDIVFLGGKQDHPHLETIGHRKFLTEHCVGGEKMVSLLETTMKIPLLDINL